MAWNSLTNLRAVETTTRLVVAICHQMEDWRRLLRLVERLEQEREAAPEPRLQRQRVYATRRSA